MPLRNEGPDVVSGISKPTPRRRKKLAPIERMAVFHEKPKKRKRERMAVMINGRSRILG